MQLCRVSPHNPDFAPKTQKTSIRVSHAATLGSRGRASRKSWFPLEPKHAVVLLHTGPSPFSQKAMKSQRVNKEEQDTILQVQL